MCPYAEVEQMISGMCHERVDTYCEYWRKITPDCERGKLNRWLFAFASVHTTWQANLRLYKLLAGTDEWFTNTDVLHTICKDSRAGLHHNRTKYISSFVNSSGLYRLAVNKTGGCNELMRNYFVSQILGLGLAKTSFAFELLDPIGCQVVCLDTHMLQLYGLKPGAVVTKKTYNFMEQHWVKCCNKNNIPPAIARHIFWDNKQKQPNTRYWSYVFEDYKLQQDESLPCAVFEGKVDDAIS